MPSSTSSSNPAPLDRWSAALLASLLLLLAGAEALTRVFLVPSSKVLSRYQQETDTARSAGPRNRLLVCGNSTLAENVDFPALRKSLEPHWQAERWSMDDTRFFDWYYALRSLRAQNKLPAALAIVLAPFQIIPAQARDTFFAHYLLDPSDLLRASWDLSLHPTDAASMALAIPSRFYATRQDLRKNLIRRFVPFLPHLMASLVSPQQQSTLPLSRQSDVYRARLNLLAAEASITGIPVLLILPSLREATPAEEAVMAATQAPVRVLRPAPSGHFPASLYRDGLHMTPEGAAAYTPFFARAIQEALPRRP
ncbi:hypothetical protein WDZ92_00085 [Nostoc sp. NIES-2111]